MIGLSRRRSYAISAAAVWICGPLTYLALEAVATVKFRHHYSYVHDFISDLGRDGPQAYLMNTAFCLQGTLFLVGAVLIVRAVEPRTTGLFLTFAAANAVGNILIAIFHSGPTAQADGTAWVHATGALLAIAGGNAAILAGSSIGPRWYLRVSVWVGVVGLLSFLMLVIELKNTAVHPLPPAVWERSSVYSILGWQMFTAAVLCDPTGRWLRLGS